MAPNLTPERFIESGMFVRGGECLQKYNVPQMTPRVGRKSCAY